MIVPNEAKYTFAVDVMLTGCIPLDVRQELMYAKHY